MANGAVNDGGRHWNAWRIGLWGTAGLILLLPLLAMQFTNEVNWDDTDFIFAGVLIGGVGLTFEGTVRMTHNTAYRAAVAFALAAAFLIIWLNGAVGIVGSEENAFNLIYYAVLAIALASVFVAALRPEGMARATIAAAAALAFAAVIALLAGEHRTEPSSVAQILGVTGFLAAPWLVSAWLFRKAARDQASADSAMQSRMNDAPRSPIR